MQKHKKCGTTPTKKKKKNPKQGNVIPTKVNNFTVKDFNERKMAEIWTKNLKEMIEE
jgi:hypothetical protein